MRTVAAGLLAVLLAGAGATAAIAAGTHGASSKQPKTITVSGTVLAVNGDLVQFREDDGTTISVDQTKLVENGQPLTEGGHFALHGHFSNDIFIAEPNTGGGDSGNGYPSGGMTSVRGTVTAIAGSRVTITQGLFATITLNDQEALNANRAQNLAVGQQVVALGYWSGGTFYATSIG